MEVLVHERSNAPASTVHEYLAREREPTHAVEVLAPRGMSREAVRAKVQRALDPIEALGIETAEALQLLGQRDGGALDLRAVERFNAIVDKLGREVDDNVEAQLDRHIGYELDAARAHESGRLDLDRLERDTRSLTPPMTKGRGGESAWTQAMHALDELAAGEDGPAKALAHRAREELVRGLAGTSDPEESEPESAAWWRVHHDQPIAALDAEHYEPVREAVKRSLDVLAVEGANASEQVRDAAMVPGLVADDERAMLWAWARDNDVETTANGELAAGGRAMRTVLATPTSTASAAERELLARASYYDEQTGTTARTHRRALLIGADMGDVAQHDEAVGAVDRTWRRCATPQTVREPQWKPGEDGEQLDQLLAIALGWADEQPDAERERRRVRDALCAVAQARETMTLDRAFEYGDPSQARAAAMRLETQGEQGETRAETEARLEQVRDRITTALIGGRRDEPWRPATMARAGLSIDEGPGRLARGLRIADAARGTSWWSQLEEHAPKAAKLARDASRARTDRRARVME